MHTKRASQNKRLKMDFGGDLLFRAVSSQVPSALKGLTSVFGMGTGGTPSPLPPKIVSSSLGLRFQVLAHSHYISFIPSCQDLFETFAITCLLALLRSLASLTYLAFILTLYAFWNAQFACLLASLLALALLTFVCIAFARLVIVLLS